MTHQQPNPELPDPPSSAFVVAATAGMRYSERLAELRQRFAETTKDPELLLALREEADELEKLIDELSEGL